MASCPCSLQLWTVIAPAGLCVKSWFWAEGGMKQKKQLARQDGQPAPCWHALVGRWKTENVGKKLTGQTEGEGVRHSVPSKPQSLQKELHRGLASSKEPSIKCLLQKHRGHTHRHFYFFLKHHITLLCFKYLYVRTMEVIYVYSHRYDII